MALSEMERLHLLRRVMLAGRGARDTVLMPKALLAELLKEAFPDLVDSDWYLDRNPDVAQAVAAEDLPSALDHYTLIGLYEGRMPYEVDLDAAAYLKTHRDVAAAVKSGELQGALEHFLSVGFAEGRAFRLDETEG